MFALKIFHGNLIKIFHFYSVKIPNLVIIEHLLKKNCQLANNLISINYIEIVGHVRGARGHLRDLSQERKTFDLSCIKLKLLMTDLMMFTLIRKKAAAKRWMKCEIKKLCFDRILPFQMLIQLVLLPYNIFLSL